MIANLQLARGLISLLLNVQTKAKPVSISGLVVTRNWTNNNLARCDFNSKSPKAIFLRKLFSWVGERAIGDLSSVLGMHG